MLGLFEYELLLGKDYVDVSDDSECDGSCDKLF